MMLSLNFRSSSAVWSNLVEMIRLPWLLKLATTTLRCLEVQLEVRMVLTWVTIRLGSGLLSGGIPFSRNCMTSLEGWWEELGLSGVLGALVGGVACLAEGEDLGGALRLVGGVGKGLVRALAKAFGAWTEPCRVLLLGPALVPGSSLSSLWAIWLTSFCRSEIPVERGFSKRLTVEDGSIEVSLSSSSSTSLSL